MTAGVKKWSLHFLCWWGVAAGELRWPASERRLCYEVWTRRVNYWSLNWCQPAGWSGGPCRGNRVGWLFCPGRLTQRSFGSPGSEQANGAPLTPGDLKEALAYVTTQRTATTHLRWFLLEWPQPMPSKTWKWCNPMGRQEWPGGWRASGPSEDQSRTWGSAFDVVLPTRDDPGPWAGYYQETSGQRSLVWCRW